MINLRIEYPKREFYSASRNSQREAVARALDQTIQSNGPCVAHLERLFAERFNVAHCVAMSSATLALTLAVRAIAAPGVIGIPAFGFPATALAGIWNSPAIQFLDCDTETLNIASNALALGPDTGCVVTLAVAGNLTGLAAIYRKCKSAGVPVVVDAAAWMGTESSDIGAIGDIIVISLSGKKPFPIGEGGLALTNSHEIARVLKQLRTYGYAIENGFELGWIGLNARMSELHAANGIAMFDELPAVMAKRSSLMVELRKVVEGFAEFELQSAPSDCAPNISEVVFKAKARAVRDSLIEHLRSGGLDAVPFFDPVLSEHCAIRRVASRAARDNVPRAIECAGQCVGVKPYSSWTDAHVAHFRDILGRFNGRGR